MYIRHTVDFPFVWSSLSFRRKPADAPFVYTVLTCWFCFFFASLLLFFRWLVVRLLLCRHLPLLATLPPWTPQQMPPSRRQPAQRPLHDRPSVSVPQQYTELVMTPHARHNRPRFCELCWNVSTLSVLLPLLFVILICLTLPRLMLPWLLAMLLSLPLLIYLKRYRLSRSGIRRLLPHRSLPVCLLLRFGPKVKLRTRLYGRTPS